jgi:hypothetical protein
MVGAERVGVGEELETVVGGTIVVGIGEGLRNTIGATAVVNVGRVCFDPNS